MVSGDWRQSGSVGFEDLLSGFAVVIRAALDWMMGTIQACGSAVTVGANVRHGQAVWGFYDVDRLRTVADAHRIGAGVYLGVMTGWYWMRMSRIRSV